MTAKEKLKELEQIIHRFDVVIDECLDYFDPACGDEAYDEIMYRADSLRRQGLKLIDSLQNSLSETEKIIFKFLKKY